MPVCLHPVVHARLPHHACGNAWSPDITAYDARLPALDTLLKYQIRFPSSDSDVTDCSSESEVSPARFLLRLLSESE